MPCLHGKMLRKLVREIGPLAPNVVKLRESREALADRQALIGALGRYCVRRCGGCAMTREMGMP